MRDMKLTGWLVTAILLCGMWFGQTAIYAVPGGTLFYVGCFVIITVCIAIPVIRDRNTKGH